MRSTGFRMAGRLGIHEGGQGARGQKNAGIHLVRGTRTFGHLHPHTEVLPRSSQDLASAAMEPLKAEG